MLCPFNEVQSLGLIFWKHGSNMNIAMRTSVLVGLSSPKSGRRPSRRIAVHATLDLGGTGPPGPLVVVGSANIDYVWRVSRMPVVGETLDADSLSVFPGGKVQR